MTTENYTIDDVMSWVNEGKFKLDVDVLEWTENRLAFRMYTDTNSYIITANNPDEGYVKEVWQAWKSLQEAKWEAGVEKLNNKGRPPDAGYLGCIASSRKPRAGETWTRGSDLHDGDLNKETWYGILADIVSYESVKIHKKHNSKTVMQTVRKD